MGCAPSGTECCQSQSSQDWRRTEERQTHTSLLKGGHCQEQTLLHNVQAPNLFPPVYIGSFLLLHPTDLQVVLVYYLHAHHALQVVFFTAVFHKTWCYIMLPQFPKIILLTSVSVYIFLTTSSCLLYTSPSPRDRQKSRMPSSA